MLRGRRIFLVLISVAALTVSASAGVIVQPQTEEQICYSKAHSNVNYSPSIHDDHLKSEFHLCYDNTLPEVSEDLTSEEDIPDYQPLTDGTNSLSLCLSTLLGFGLLGSVRYVKKFSLGFVPDWYHDGGPFQVGHSVPINPDCHCVITHNCFIQPIIIKNSCLEFQKFRYKQVVSLWRDSQFAPDAVTSRGPPLS